MDISERSEFHDGNQSQIECLLFDLDDTLYPLSSGIAAASRENVLAFLGEHLGIDAEAALDFGQELYQTYGTVLGGLVARGYKFDVDEYFRIVDGSLPYQVLKPDPVLRNLLLSMPQRRLVFTNANKIHAFKVLSRMGLEDCFEDVICFETFNPIDNITTTMPVLCKPSIEAFRRAVQIAGADPVKTLFLDDSPRNIKAAKAAGLQTALVGSLIKVDGADHAIESIHNLRDALPEIWQEQNVIFSGSAVPAEAVVAAA